MRKPPRCRTHRRAIFPAISFSQKRFQYPPRLLSSPRARIGFLLLSTFVNFIVPLWGWVGQICGFVSKHFIKHGSWHQLGPRSGLGASLGLRFFCAFQVLVPTLAAVLSVKMACSCCCGCNAEQVFCHSAIESLELRTVLRRKLVALTSVF